MLEITPTYDDDTLDLSKGYWQLPMAEESIEKTAFMTEDGKYHFTRMPFGLKGAPSNFQRYINTLLAKVQDFAKAYMDDVVIFSETWSDHLKHLERVFTILTEQNLTIKERKCQIGMRILATSWDRDR